MNTFTSLSLIPQKKMCAKILLLLCSKDWMVKTHGSDKARKGKTLHGGRLKSNQGFESVSLN